MKKGTNQSFFKQTEWGCLLSLKVTPNAGKNQIGSCEQDRLQIRVTATPEKGEANKAVIALLSKSYKIPKSSIEVVRGSTSREKEVAIYASPEKINQILLLIPSP